MMAAKKKPEQKKDFSVIQAKGTETEDEVLARTMLRPSVQAAFTIHTFEKTEVRLKGFLDELTAQVEAVNNGDMKRAEEILITQAHTLNELFNSLARRAGNQEYLKQYETYLRLALKAQGQCRATLETLATIKNPPVVFARQANISNGPQQVNNGVASSTPAEKIINQQNKLLEVQHGSKTMDTRTAGTTGCADPAMATLGEVNRG